MILIISNLTPTGEVLVETPKSNEANATAFKVELSFSLKITSSMENKVTLVI